LLVHHHALGRGAGGGEQGGEGNQGDAVHGASLPGWPVLTSLDRL
jgi:hypothetical protein